MSNQTSNSTHNEVATVSFATHTNDFKLHGGKITVTVGDTYTGHNPPPLTPSPGSAVKISMFNNCTKVDVDGVECTITGGNVINDLRDPVNVNDTAVVNNVRGPALVVAAVAKDEDGS
ncbi:hypothetical protein BDN70DRAFT_899721 [Pholiota conissans]|uniref:Uncharacterized protein n=1 Tax=Pholiota conissans TaxID=109636 RepID=A0A9P6CNH3_9AGAR|nr:hypothetical protein BDN70DRAFT_899721 [Pholiota conissans]